jgi:glycosyltransferase involved in cell wall biosynthesis
VEDFAPDLIQVWGTEYFWGLFTARRIICKPALLEMQGLKCAYARVFNGDLGFAELLRCIRPKDVVRRSSVFSQRAAFKRWTSFEREIIKGHRFVGTQSDWIDAWVKSINPSCTTFRNDVVLRAPFYGAQWREPNSRNVFCSAAYPVPYKGLHVAIRALAHLTPKFPDVQLRIAGLHQRPALRQTGYVAWLNRQLRTLGLCDRVIWLGALNAAEIVREMRGCAAMVLPTFIENYCTAMQEAMSIGVPLVASYAGGLPSLARDEQSCLFFPPGDEVMCAHQLGRLLSDPQLSHRISGEAHRIALARNEPQKVLARQIEIYRQVLGMAGDEN